MPKSLLDTDIFSELLKGVGAVGVTRLAWLERAGRTLLTRRLYARGDGAVAEQHGAWRSSGGRTAS